MPKRKLSKGERRRRERQSERARAEAPALGRQHRRASASLFTFRSGSTLAISGLPEAPAARPSPTPSRMFQALMEMPLPPPAFYEGMVSHRHHQDRLRHGYWFGDDDFLAAEDAPPRLDGVGCGMRLCESCYPQGFVSIGGEAHGRVTDAVMALEDGRFRFRGDRFDTEVRIEETLEWRQTGAVTRRNDVLGVDAPREEVYVRWNLRGRVTRTLADARGFELLFEALRHGEPTALTLRFESGRTYAIAGMRVRADLVATADGDGRPAYALTWEGPRDFVAERRTPLAYDRAHFEYLMRERERERPRFGDDLDSRSFSRYLARSMGVDDRHAVRARSNGRAYEHTFTFRERTAEERARYEAQEVERRRRDAEAEQQRMERMREQLERELAVKERARALLLSKLTADERACFEENGYIEVTGSRTGHRYRIMTDSYVGNVKELDNAGRVIASYCAAPGGPIPLDDKILGQYLTLKFDEQIFLDKANVTLYPNGERARGEFRGPMYRRRSADEIAELIGERLLRALQGRRHLIDWDALNRFAARAAEPVYLHETLHVVETPGIQGRTVRVVAEGEVTDAPREIARFNADDMTRPAPNAAESRTEQLRQAIAAQVNERIANTFPTAGIVWSWDPAGNGRGRMVNGEVAYTFNEPDRTAPTNLVASYEPAGHFARLSWENNDPDARLVNVEVLSPARMGLDGDMIITDWVEAGSAHYTGSFNATLLAGVGGIYRFRVRTSRADGTHSPYSAHALLTVPAVSFARWTVREEPGPDIPPRP